MKKKKLSLGELKVQSFVTSETNSANVKGGATVDRFGNCDTILPGNITADICRTMPAPLGNCPVSGLPLTQCNGTVAPTKITALSPIC